MGEIPREERRRAPRIILREPVGGTISTSVEATLVNLSPTGALLEHPHAVRIGQPYILVVTLSPQEVRLRCRVVRSGIQSDPRPRDWGAGRHLPDGRGVPGDHGRDPPGPAGVDPDPAGLNPEPSLA